MAVAGITEVKGDPEDVLARYDSVMAKRDGRRSPGHISHTCVELPDGFRIANLWETEEQLWAAWNREDFQQALREAGLTPSQPRVYRVHRYDLAAATAATSG